MTAPCRVVVRVYGYGEWPGLCVALSASRAFVKLDALPGLEGGTWTGPASDLSPEQASSAIEAPGAPFLRVAGHR